VDGGFRHGGEVLVALALGARAVLVGRPALWSLALAGTRGVTGMLGLLQYQLAATMARVGATRVADIGPHMITPARPGAAAAPDASRDEGGSA
jgi:isopentenyl diphosphate isomerase/L-lactate dehydrogenase-like FMN-dependent dehydrogenase